MTKIIDYIFMIFLAGSGAALSAVKGRGASSLRAFVLGTFLALSIVVGDYYIRKQRYTSKFFPSIDWNVFRFCCRYAYYYI